MAGVSGSIIVPALAGYTRTASGISSSGVSVLVARFRVTVAQFDWIKRFPEGSSHVRG